MPCKHQPVINFKVMTSRTPKYKCRHCDASIEMAPPFNTINRIASTVFLLLLVLKAISNTTSFGLTGVPKLLVDLGIMLGLVLIYLAAMLLLANYSKYREVEIEPEPEVVPDPEQPTQPEYTQEQLDLMAIYAAYEKQAGIEPSPATSDAAVQPEPEADTCEHAPTSTWKNYVPGQFNFTCVNCGKAITFPTAFKKRINMIFMLVAFAIILPFFSDMSIEFWVFGLLTLLVLAITAVIQLICLKKGRYELRVEEKK